MDMNELLIEAHKALDDATICNDLGSEAGCMYYLGGLHELLIKYIETEKIPEPQKCRVCGCTDLKACPEICHWVEGNLCSICADISL